MFSCLSFGRCAPRVTADQHRDDYGQAQAVSCPAERLPEGIILQILSYLDLTDRTRASQVCKQWHRLCSDYRFWRKIAFPVEDRYKGVSNKTIKRLLSYTDSVHRVDMSSPACRLLNNMALYHIAHSCMNLKELIVCGRTKITDVGIKLVVRGCPYLEILEMEMCSRISNRSLKYISKFSPRLKTLNVRGCRRISDAGVVVIAQKCCDLTSLNISECSKITDVGVKVITNCCPKLKFVSLKSTKNVSDSGVEYLLRKTKLTGLELGLMRSGRASAAVLYSVAYHCNNLQELEFELPTPTQIDDVICRLAEHCHTLRTLVLKQCYPLCSRTLMLLSKSCPDLKQLHLYPQSYSELWSAL